MAASHYFIFWNTPILNMPSARLLTSHTWHQCQRATISYFEIPIIWKTNVPTECNYFLCLKSCEFDKGNTWYRLQPSHLWQIHSAKLTLGRREDDQRIPCKMEKQRSKARSNKETQGKDLDVTPTPVPKCTQNAWGLEQWNFRLDSWTMYVKR